MSLDPIYFLLPHSFTHTFRLHGDGGGGSSYRSDGEANADHYNDYNSVNDDEVSASIFFCDTDRLRIVLQEKVLVINRMHIKVTIKAI